MDIQWSMIWAHAKAIPVRSKKQHDAFADPLERDEWEGLRWSVPLVSWLVASRSAQKNRQKIKEVERFTETAPAQAVCVS
jgi:hypothetical protein